MLHAYNHGDMKQFVNLKCGKKFPAKKSKRISRSDTTPKFGQTNSSLSFAVSDISRFTDVCHDFYYVTNNNLNVSWTQIVDKDNVGILEVRASISSGDNCGVTITFYFTTGTVRLQGSDLQPWVTHDYPQIKDLYQNMSFSPTKSSDTFDQSLNLIDFQDDPSDDDIQTSVSSVLTSIIDTICNDKPRDSESTIPTPTIQPPTPTMTPVKTKKPKSSSPSSSKTLISTHWMNNITNVINKMDEKLSDIAEFETSFPLILETTIQEAMKPIIEENKKQKGEIDSLSQCIVDLKSQLDDIPTQLKNSIKVSKQECLQKTDEQGAEITTLKQSVANEKKSLEKKVASLTDKLKSATDKYDSKITSLETKIRDLTRLINPPLPSNIADTTIINMNSIDMTLTP